MLKISKGKLKAKMLAYFRHVEATGEELIIMNNNIPTLKVIPIKSKKQVEQIFADLRGKVKIDDSVMTSETEEWGDSV
jgi:antitoxin (DNA-binding transcriptional repressor) of toxin-antitoxin stability system